MRCLVAILLALVLPSPLLAQRTEDDIRARLIDKPLYLRGQWGGDKLAFDAAGNATRSGAAVPFTVAGINVESVRLTLRGLTVQGQRMGLMFDSNGMSRLDLRVGDGPGKTKQEKMTIQIQLPANGDFTPALDAIFTDSLADLVPQMPDYWQTYGRKHFVAADAGSAPVAGGAVAGRAGAGGAKEQPNVGVPNVGVPNTPPAPAEPKLARIGGAVTAPKLLHQVKPQFSEAARATKFHGVSMLSFVVDASGTPQQIRVLRPVGMGLDEQAVGAVSKYVFQPAMRDGSPVAVQLNVEVNFQIF